MKTPAMAAIVLALASTPCLGESMVIEQGPHHQVLRQVMQTEGEDGSPLFATNHFTAVATGLGYLGDNGKWQASSSDFELIDGGAAAWKGQHRVTLAWNSNLPQAVQMVTPDGQRLDSHVHGLAYYDTASGQAVLIAEPKDTQGVLVEPGVILYEDAFEGVVADLRYRNSLSGTEQDVVVRESIPSPESFGLNPESTELQVWTEFDQAPDPRRSASMADRKGPNNTHALVPDETLDFGAMRIGTGRSFRHGKEDESLSLVTKMWLVSDGRKFLVEAVPVNVVTDAVDLPSNGSGGASIRKPGLGREVVIHSIPRKARREGLPKGRIQRATEKLLASYSRPGVVLDYSTLNTTQSNYTFKGDTTYFIAGLVSLNGTNNVFEGGAVLKFTNSVGTKLVVNTPVTWLGTPYRPVVLTARDDWSVGDGITPSNALSGFYAEVALSLNPPHPSTVYNLAHLRITHAKTAIEINQVAGHVISHAQFVNCQVGIAPAGTDFSLRNALFANTNASTTFQGTSSTGRLEHVTVDGAATFNSGSTFNSLYLTNCLLAGITTLGTTTVTNQVAVLTNSSGVFQTALAGAHYLPVTSMFRDVGEHAIDPVLLKELTAMTTHAPQLVTGPWTNSVTLESQSAYSDWDESLDLGYHYAAIDYYCTGLTVANATVTLTNGVALAVYGDNGLQIGTATTLRSEGNPGMPNRIFRYPAVQEQPIVYGTYPSGLIKVITPPAIRPVLGFRFTDFPALAGPEGAREAFDIGSYHASSIEFMDCQFRGSVVKCTEASGGSGLTTTFAMVNCVAERATLYLGKYWWGYDVNFTAGLWNNLFWNGTVTLNYDTHATYNPAWTVRDNHFDNVALTQGGTGITNIVKSHNAYQSTTSLGGTNNVTLTAFPYATGPLGNWYQGATSLMNLGSRTAADAGLYHYTTQVTSTKEGTDLTSSQVDIGYHHVATAVRASEGFGSLQYGNNWYYQRTDSLSGDPPYQTNSLTYVASGDPYTPRWEQSYSTPLYCWIGPNWQHPADASDSVRTYTIQQAGPITIDGSAYDDAPGNGDGVRLRIQRRAANATRMPLLDWTSVPDGTTSASPVAARVTTPVDVARGDWLHFQLNRNGNNNGDLTFWDPRISFPNPLDTAGDGIPDYAEDTNGNGVHDGNESDWTKYDTDGDGLDDLEEMKKRTDPHQQDTDGDGVSDSVEVFQNTNPLDGHESVPQRLAWWRFNSSGLTNEAGGTPIANTAAWEDSFDGMAASFTNSSNELRYPYAWTNGIGTALTNFNLWNGAVRLTYVPAWYNGGTNDKPNAWCRLLACGDWALSINPDGTQLVFQSPGTNGLVQTNLSVDLPRPDAAAGRIGWEISLNYTPYKSWLLINQKASLTVGGGVQMDVPAAARSQGLRIGSATNGTYWAQGFIDELETFTIPVGIVPVTFDTLVLPRLWDPNARHAQFMTASDTGNGIQLNWLRGWEGDWATNGNLYSISRRPAGTIAWTTVVTNARASTWTDTSAVLGSYYEYRIGRHPGVDVGSLPSIAAARKGAPVDARGRAILLVDGTISNAISGELEVFKRDLIADGWQVLATNAPRHVDLAYPTPDAYAYTNATTGAVVTNKANAGALQTYLRNNYNSDTNLTNVVFIIGHVTIPYSGFASNTDGHGDHRGAFPADAWYGDVTANWSDGMGGAYPPDVINYNEVGDGRWDRDVLPAEPDGSPGRLEMAVGRIDFSIMAPFQAAGEPISQTEVRMLKLYFDKVHRYRRGQIAFQDDYVAWIPDGNFFGLIPTVQRLKSRIWGGEVFDAGRFDDDLFLATTNHLWGIHGDYGYFTAFGNNQGLGRVHTSVKIGKETADNVPRGMFQLHFGSWFGEWFHGDTDPMRVVLGMTNSVMTSTWLNVWQGTVWRPDRFHLGAHYGTALQDTFAANAQTSCRTTAILGDPMLREHPLAPVDSLAAAKSSANIVLSWPSQSAATDGYRIYRATSTNSASWSRMIDLGSGSVGWTNVAPGNGTYAYLIKAMSLKTTTSGSYTNMSIGTFSSTEVTLP